MKTITLTRNKVTLVDDIDYDNLRRFSWHALPSNYTFYAVRRITGSEEGSTRVFMHNMILPPIPNLELDHKDRNGLNNQRYNLRYSTKSQNLANSESRPNTSSKYKGVSRDRSTNLWLVRIQVENKAIHLGRFHKEKDAALTYNLAAIENFGEFARLNIINTPVNREQLMEKLISLEKGEQDGK